MVIHGSALVLMVYYGTALGFSLWTPKQVWMESFLYGVSLSELPMMLMYVAVRPFQAEGLNLEAISFVLYLTMSIIVSFLLILKKSWARRIILIQQSLRVCYLFLYAVLSLMINASASYDKISTRWMSLSTTTGFFFIFILPSVIIWYVLTRPSIRKEFP